MRILILGAGRVGESVAETLASEANDITIVDPDPARLHAIEEKLEVQGIAGNGVQPSVLRQAGVNDCDLFIACTSLDETNLVACKIAHDNFRVPTTIARLRSPEFSQGSKLLGKDGFAVDKVICPEASVTKYIHQLIQYPEALQVLQFSQGHAHMVTMRVSQDSFLAGHTIAEFRQARPDVQMRIVAIYRNGEDIPSNANAKVQAGDEIMVVVARSEITSALHAIGNPDRPVKRVMIAGGGKVGLRLARGLIGKCQVKIIEASRMRCEYLAGELPTDMLVLHGDVADEDLLDDENVGDMDLFLALTNDDEDNIMAAMLAKRMGARRVIALINRRAYAEMMQASTIDIAISPAHAVIGELLMHVRKGSVAAVHSLRGGSAEAMEGIARGDRKTSRLVGRKIEELPLPLGARVGAIVRGEGDDAHVIDPKHDTVIETMDHIIIFLPHKRMVKQVEKLFQVRATFL